MNNESIRSFCLSLPKVTEDIKWGSDLCFCIGKKMFCVISTTADISVCFKCSEEDFNLLCERDGIIPAPYMARNKWVLMQKAFALNKNEWKQFIKISYDLVAAGLSKKLKIELGLL
jgi:predicted DNA-binding protein (MmcQ/YjbR family)